MGRRDDKARRELHCHVVIPEQARARLLAAIDRASMIETFSLESIGESQRSPIVLTSYLFQCSSRGRRSDDEWCSSKDTQRQCHPRAGPAPAPNA